MKFTISNTTLVVFIPNFTATHAITSTNTLEYIKHDYCILLCSAVHRCPINQLLTSVV